MNVIIISGRLVKDVEVNSYGNNTKVVSNTIAVYDGKDKDKNDLTYFFDFKAFNYTATKLSSQAQKGSKIAIEGVLKQDKWEDENGKHSKVIIYAENVEIIQEQPKQDKPEEEQESDNLPW